MTTQPQSGAVSSADEASFIDIRDRAARLCQLAETELVMKPAREIIILCERALARRNSQSGAAMEPTQADQVLLDSLREQVDESAYVLSYEESLVRFRQHVASETAGLKQIIEVGIKEQERQAAVIVAQAAQIDTLRAKLQDIHVTAHCISKAGPLSTPTLGVAWSKFDRIACMAVSGLAATTLGGDEKNALGKPGKHTSDLPLIGSDPLSGAAEEKTPNR